MVAILKLTPQLLDLPGQCLITVAGEHVSENGTGGAQLHVVVVALLDQAMQFIRRDGAQSRQVSYGGLDQLTARLVNTVAEGGIGKTPAYRGLGATSLLGGGGDRGSGSQRQHESFIAILFAATGHVKHP
jgi:hypothetical protein